MDVKITKASAKAQSNTALIKYWGKRDEELIIPLNNSISMTTDALSTITTVEFSDEYSQDLFYLNDQLQTGKSLQRVSNHLNIIRKMADCTEFAKVKSENNFPTASGLASSASGFAALTVAACSALKLKLDKRELSMVARRGSGSSCRSIYGGFVEWIAFDDDHQSYAIQLAKKDHFNIRDLVVVLDAPERKVYTREAMKISQNTSPFMKTRLELISKSLENIRVAITEKNFDLLGSTAEMDCLSMHAVALTSYPSLLFWTPETISVINCIENLREQGISTYYTIDTGANMHVLATPKDEKTIIDYLDENVNINQIISSKPGEGTKVILNHLF
ncbi:MAG: diphosphomevalonate decarboxylase [Candidatus Thorarchaeota archaeon]